MITIVERERRGGRLTDRVLYSGDDKTQALRVEYFETQSYHRRKIQRDGENTIVVLEVDS